MDMGAMYRFFMNVMQAGIDAGVAGGNAGVGVLEALVVNNCAILSSDYVRLGGKPFIGTEDVVEVESWLLHYERIFTDLGINDEQKRRLASRRFQEAALLWWNSVTVGVDEETMI